MTPEEGYLVLPQVLPMELVQRLNTEIDKLETLNDEDAAAIGIMRKYHDQVETGEKDDFTADRSRDYDCNVLRLGGPVEELIDCPVALVSTSPERDDTILVTDPFAD